MRTDLPSFATYVFDNNDKDFKVWADFVKNIYKTAILKVQTNTATFDESVEPIYAQPNTATAI